MKLVTLTDNRTHAPELKTEHGLSVYIETEQHKILFDTGQSGLFVENAEQLGVDLKAVDMAIISHGHYDHIGGLPHFIQLNPDAPIIMKREVFDTPYQSIKAGKVKQIGPSDELKQQMDRFTFPREVITSIDNIHIIQQIDTPYPRPKGNQLLYKTEAGESVHDDFQHELLLVIENEGKLVVFTGCAHHGVLNMIHTAKQHFPNEPIQLVFGGFHLISPNSFAEVESEADLQQITQALQELIDPQTAIYTGHCTGEDVSTTLTQQFGHNLRQFHTGLTLHL